MKALLFNANIVLETRVVHGFVIVSDGVIEQIGTGNDYPKNEAFDYRYDCQSLFLSPGFVELHSHGAGGSDFMDGTADSFEIACDTHLSHGTTSLLPTTLAASKEEILGSIAACKQSQKELKGKTLNILGLHFEGPYLCKEQCGAIDPKYIRNPDPEEYEEFLDVGKGIIKRWTIAVELGGMDRFITRLCENGILPSIGHSNAEYCQVLNAYEKGVTHVTHLYSAMSTIKRVNGFRHPGIIESAFCIPGMTVELIADGCHLPLELLRMVYEIKGTKKTALVCDSMRCAGQDVLESVLGSKENGQRVIIEDEVAKMPDRKAFAGSIALDDRLIRVMVNKVGIPIWDAVRMMTLTPSEIIGVDDRKGSIEKGKDADLVLFDGEIDIKGVMVGGKVLKGFAC